MFNSYWLDDGSQLHAAGRKVWAASCRAKWSNRSIVSLFIHSGSLRASTWDTSAGKCVLLKGKIKCGHFWNPKISTHSDNWPRWFREMKYFFHVNVKKKSIKLKCHWYLFSFKSNIKSKVVFTISVNIKIGWGGIGQYFCYLCDCIFSTLNNIEQRRIVLNNNNIIFEMHYFGDQNKSKWKRTTKNKDNLLYIHSGSSPQLNCFNLGGWNCWSRLNVDILFW